jgi:hypothetical protein
VAVVVGIARAALTPAPNLTYFERDAPISCARVFGLGPTDSEPLAFSYDGDRKIALFVFHASDTPGPVFGGIVQLLCHKFGSH